MRDAKEPEPLQDKEWGGECCGTDIGLVDGDVSEKIPPKRVNFFLE